MRDFSGKVALVTGTTGIGRAVAKRFAEGGASILWGEATAVAPRPRTDIAVEPKQTR